MANTKDITFSKLKVLVWGEYKSGKTVFASTAPRPYFFDLDNGMLSLAGKDIEYTTYQGSNAWHPLMQDLESVAKRDDIDTLVIDSLTSLQDILMNDIQRVNGTLGGAPQIQEYGLFMVRVRKFLFDIIGVDKHVILTSHEQIYQDETTGEVFITPLIYGKNLPKRMGMWFDEVYHAETETDREGNLIYWIRTQSSRKHRCGSRLDVLDALEKPDFMNILKKAKEKGKEVK